ncbi:hypothetical protein ZIOFF_033163 [Zingiber officinale]|uniref:Uncharacterized protein n=1 Tax=Zingiber officinale TaxID=94328 RepID=A0A8J5GQ52_ZINOF|nr:hypothetical protein ZIOFF_033163 [Zingiber officinale]
MNGPAVYDIARKIWSASTKSAHDSDEEDINSPNSNAIITVRIHDGSMSSERRNSISRRLMRRRMIEEAAAGVLDPTSAIGGVDVDRSTPPMQTPLAPEAVIPNIIEETVKSCLSPLFKELINGTSPLNFLALSLGCGSLTDQGLPMDEKWRK